MPVTFPKLNPLNGILIILGLHPLHPERKPKWFQKLRLIGVICSVNQLLLTIYTFLCEHEAKAMTGSFSNNILFGFVMIKKSIAFAMPFACLALRCCSYKLQEQLLDRISLYDAFSKQFVHCQQVQEDLEQKLRKINWFAAVFVLLVELLNIATAFPYMLMVRSVSPTIQTIHFYHSAILIFMSSSLSNYSALYGILLRHQLFNDFVNSLWQRGWSSERKERKNKRIFLMKIASN